jgi:hypothetical protein
MKKISILLAAMGALTALALIGPGAASAATGDTVLCKTNSNPCALANQYPANTSFTAGSTNAVLSTSSGNVTCTSSSTTVKNTAQNGSPNPLPGSVTALSFSGCKLGTTNCTVTAQNIPYDASNVAIGSSGNGTLNVDDSGTTDPSASVVCGFFINCTFGKPTVSGAVTGGNPASVSFNTTLNRTGGICPSTATWTATYTLNGTNTALWVEPSA